MSETEFTFKKVWKESVRYGLKADLRRRRKPILPSPLFVSPRHLYQMVGASLKQTWPFNNKGGNRTLAATARNKRSLGKAAIHKPMRRIMIATVCTGGRYAQLVAFAKCGQIAEADIGASCSERSL